MSKRVATGLLVLALAGAGLGNPQQPGAAAADQLAPVASHCTDVLVLGAAGDGERPGAGLGPTLDRVATSVRAAARADGSARSVSVQAVPFRTRPASTLRGSSRATLRADRAVKPVSKRRWGGDLAGYSTRVLTALQRAATQCPSQRVVLTGYAQGAAAVHRSLRAVGTRAPAAQDQVSAAVLVSDPHRVPRTRGRLLGAPAAPLATAGVLRRGPIADARSTQAVPVYSVCNRGDLVCDLGRSSVRHGIRRHDSYSARTSARVLSTAGAGAYDSVSRAVLAPAAVVSLSAVQGQPVNELLPVRVRAADRGAVRAEPTTTMPPGISVSTSGVLQGTPTRAGTWNLGYRLSNSAAPWTPHVTATATLTVTEPAPVAAAAGRVSAGGQSTCTITDAEALRCWGANDRGQLASGAKVASRTSPVASTSWSDWSQVDVGGSTTCGIRADRSLWCWGLNHKGQIGDGTRTDRANPTRVTTATDWSQVSVDWFTTCATKTDGRAFCWGQNWAGQIGDGTKTNRLTPRQLPGTGWVQVETGGWHSCGVKKNGTAACWGRNDLGELGNGNTRGSLTPTWLPGSDWASVAVSWSNSCGVRTSGAVQCWGRGDQGQIGDGARSTRTSPATVAGGRTYTSVAVGDSHACGLATDGSAWCWGSNDYGTLGNGSATRSLTPVAAMPSLRFSSLDVGWLHTCGTTTKGTTTCWGNNTAGQLGTGGTTDTATRPVAAPGAAPAYGSPLRFNLGTYNVLGNNHTQPRAGDDDFAPAIARAQWTADVWEQRDLSVVGTQENDFGQINALHRAAHDAYSVYPGTTRGTSGAPSSLWWRTSDWTAIEKQTFAVKFMRFQRLQPAVRLRSRIDPTITIWVVNIHNTPGNSATSQASRDRALAIQTAKVNELKRTGDPVFLVGDFNERTAYCKVATATGLTSPRGGSVSGGVCQRPSGTLKIDWIFGPAGVWDQYAEVTDPLRMRTNDHRLITTRVTLN